MIFLGLSAVTNTLNQSTESKTLEMFDEPLNVILPLSQLNEPGFQEGDVLTNATLTTVSSKTCVIIDNGTVSCWGNNYNGGLGDGTTTSKSSPTQTSSLGTGRTAVAISGSCAILDNGNVSCWGFNSYGMVGDGTNNQRTTPTQTSSLGNGRTAVAISTGSGHVCAILDDGSVSCWGRNAQGVIGDGTSTNRLSPTQTLSLGTNREAVAISSGGYHTCVILDDGSVSCWGYDGYGQLGTTSGSSTNYPQQTSSLGTGRTAVAISSGGDHTCAILDDGSVSCWGANNNGQLGDGTTNRRYSPTQTSSLGVGRTAVAISSGEYHTCAILDDGSTSCWGRNDYGQLGDGTMTQRNTPTQITSLMTGPTAVAISAANGYTCAILNNGSASCWGYNHKGQLGDGTTNDHISTTQTLDIGIGRTAALSDFDIDGDGFLNHFEDFPIDSTENKDSDGDGVGDNSDEFPNDSTESKDSDGDGLGDNSDEFPNDPSETIDSDSDGVGDNSDICPLDADNDADGDGVCGDQDAFPNDPSETMDSDGDGVGDNSDEYPNDSSETMDSDGDGVGDNSDEFPNDSSETMDSDGDGVGDNSDICPLDPDNDADGDGVCGDQDMFPNDPSEAMDSDGDGVGDNSDICPLDADNDADGDGVCRDQDAFPNDPSESMDFDGDGVGDNSDICPRDFEDDADEDGVCGNIIYVGTWPDGGTQENPNGSDDVDAFPYDPSETMDSDNDGIGNNADNDDDNDGVMDYDDAFPIDPYESQDSDYDGIGDNSDICPLDATNNDADGDGVCGDQDAFPNDPSETTDSDGDGFGDNSDEFPNDPTEWLDADGDGVGDNSQNSNTDDDGNNTDTGDNGNNTDTVDSGDNVTDVDDITPSDPTEPGDTVNNGTDDNIDDTDDAIAEPITDDDSSVPGFTGILATIALLGAVYIRRNE